MRECLHSYSLDVYKVILLSLRKYRVYIDSCFAEGSSAIAYYISFCDNQCVLKELFPERLSEQKIIIRDNNGKVKFNGNIFDMFQWKKAKLSFICTAIFSMYLQKNTNLKENIVKLHGVYSANNTYYTITQKIDGVSWNYINSEPIEHIIEIGVQIAQMTETLHSMGWLMVDIKASNYVVLDEINNTTKVKMFDFNSVVSIKNIHRCKKFRCSSETAPPELLYNRNKYVGKHSDVYSIASMIFRKITQHSVGKHPYDMFLELSKPMLKEWSNERCIALARILDLALKVNPYERTATCNEFATQLLYIHNERNYHHESL